MKQIRPVISVIVPVFNTGRFLSACLDSISAQTYGEMEVITVNDGSSDNSLEICRRYAGIDHRYKVIALPDNQGQSAARNAGLDAATGQYVTFVDSDDLISPLTIEVLYNLITSSHSDMSAVRFRRFSGKLPHESCRHGRVTIMSAHQALPDMLYQSGFNPSVCGKLFTIESLHGMRFATGHIYEDLDFMARYLLSASRIASSTDSLYYYRRNPQSTLGSFSMKRLDVLEVTEAIESRAASDPQLLAAARDRRLSAAFNIFALLCRNGMARSQAANECWDTIRMLRISSLVNPRVRLKNKLGITASLAGRRLLTLIARHTSI